MDFVELDSLDFSIHQFGQSLKTMLALLFKRDSVDSLISQLDQLKTFVRRWGLEEDACEEVVLAISHMQNALRIEDTRE